VRPGCPAPAQASLTFRYASREAWIERLTTEPSPEAYDLCSSHAARTQPPHGWQLRDRRPREEQLPQPEAPARRDLGGEDTVAVLAAALRAVPEAPQEDEAADVVEADEPQTGQEPAHGVHRVSPQGAADAGDTKAAPEETASPVLGSPGAPRLPIPSSSIAEDAENAEDDLATEAAAHEQAGGAPGPDTPDPEDAPDGSVEEPPTAAGPAGPRPVPAARARGIAPPANRSVQAPHGTALDW
jgi:hypothetical protein